MEKLQNLKGIRDYVAVQLNVRKRVNVLGEIIKFGFISYVF